MSQPIEASVNEYAVAALFLASLGEELPDTRAGRPRRMVVHAGDMSPMEQCASGWVAVQSIRPTTGNGEAVGYVKGGIPTWTIALRLGVWRCYPMAGEGAAPSAVSVDSAVRDVLDDAVAMRRAILSPMVKQNGITSMVLGGYRTIGPQGGMHGGVTDVSVDVDLCFYSDQVLPMLPGDPRFEPDDGPDVDDGN